MKLEIIREGFVHSCPPEGPDSVAGTSRCAVTEGGDILCSFMLQSALGVNDFLPCIARSRDGGATWKMQGPVWPHLRGKYSMNPSIGGAPNGDLLLFGSSTPITRPGEPFWSEEAGGMLQNDLIWARSTDGGHTWTEPRAFPIPLPGAAETPAPICVTRSGNWLAPYSPHPTMDRTLEVDLRHVVLMISRDEGESWTHTSMIRAEHKDSAVAESWVVELSDGSLLGTCWHLRQGAGEDYPNAFAMSFDGGDTWRPTRSTTINGQSTGLAAWREGMALFTYNQRRHGTIGVWLAVAKPSESDFGLLDNQVVWKAAVPTQKGSSTKLEGWTDFAFGEPSVTVLPDDTLLVVFWCIQPDGRGIRFVNVKVV